MAHAKHVPDWAAFYWQHPTLCGSSVPSTHRLVAALSASDLVDLKQTFYHFELLARAFHLRPGKSLFSLADQYDIAEAYGIRLRPTPDGDTIEFLRLDSVFKYVIQMYETMFAQFEDRFMKQTMNRTMTTQGGVSHGGWYDTVISQGDPLDDSRVTKISYLILEDRCGFVNAVSSYGLDILDRSLMSGLSGFLSFVMKNFQLIGLAFASSDQYIFHVDPDDVEGIPRHTNHFWDFTGPHPPAHIQQRARFDCKECHMPFGTCERYLVFCATGPPQRWAAVEESGWCISIPPGSLINGTGGDPLPGFSWKTSAAQALIGFPDPKYSNNERAIITE